MKTIYICHYLIKLFEAFSCQIFGKTSPHLPSIFRVISLSALVSPIFTIAIGFLASTACSTILYAENVLRVVPRISKASKFSILSFTFCTLACDTLSPKNTISGFKMPPQLLQAGTLKSSTCACQIFYQNNVCSQTLQVYTYKYI